MTTIEQEPGDRLARMSDPHTSHEAAAAIGKGSVRHVLRALRLVDLGTGMTDEEMMKVVRSRTTTDYSDARLRTARKKLETLGMVEPSGRHRPSRRGRAMEVYVLTEAGRSFDLDAR